MISTPAQQDYKVTWLWGRGGGGWYDKHTRSTAADQPAPLPDYGEGEGGGHTRSTAADQPAPLPDYKVTWLWGGVGGG